MSGLDWAFALSSTAGLAAVTITVYWPRGDR